MPSKQNTLKRGTHSSPGQDVKRPHKNPESTTLDESTRYQEPLNYDPYFSGSVVRCGAKKRDGSKCRNLSMENGRCRIHGGVSVSPPEGNKYAVTHGAYEQIVLSTLTDEEVVLWESMKDSILANLDISLKIISIREIRMLKRIQALQDAGAFTTVKIVKEKGKTEKGTKDVVSKERHGTLSQIQAIEEALTKVQEKKARLLELKMKVEASNKKPDIPNFDKYYAALEKTAQEVWGDEDEEGVDPE